MRFAETTSFARRARFLAAGILFLITPGCGGDGPTQPEQPEYVTYSWRLTPDLPTVYDLNSLQATGANRFVAVGRRGLIVEHDGVSWNELTTNTIRDLWAIWTAPGGEMFAVGDYGIALERSPVGWIHMESTTSEHLRAIWGSAPDDLFAVGDAGVVVHFDGDVWAKMESMAQRPLFSVWGSGGDDVFAVGLEGTIIHYEDSGWGQMVSGTDETLASVCGAADDAVFAVGNRGTALRYDGQSWQPIATGSPDVLQSIWVTARDNAVAVGANGTILRYNGLEWTPMASPTGAWLLDVSGWSADDLTAIGSSMVVRYSGGRWSALTSGAVPSLRAVWSPSVQHAIAVGHEGAIMRFSGSRWERMESPTSRPLNAVWGSSETTVYAGGSNGRLLSFDGNEWTLDRDIGDDYHGIWGDGDGNVWVVGERGIVLHKRGDADWVAERSATTRILRGVWGFDTNLVIAVGNLGEIIERVDDQWSRVASPTSSALFDVCGYYQHRVNALQVYAVGGSGTILQRDPRLAQWQAMESGVDVPLYAVCVGPSDTVYASGEGGIILKLTGDRWVLVSSPTTEDLLGISRTQNGELFAVGGTGELSGTAILLAPQ